MTAPIVPPTGRNPAGSGQREAARDHVARLREDGGTYRSIAAAAALSPGAVHRLASGRRRAQPGTAAAVLTVTSPALPQARLDAGGTRLRLRALHVMGHGSARIARAAGAHPQTIRKLVRGDASHRQPAAPRRHRRPLRRLVGQTRPRPHPLRARPPPPPPAHAPGPETGAPPPPWTTTSSTSPATGPSTAGNPPPAPASPPTSALRPRHRRRERRCSDHRIGPGLFTDVLDVPHRHGFARGDDRHAGRAIVLIGDLARICEGTQDHPYGAITPSRCRHPGPPSPDPAARPPRTASCSPTATSAPS